MAGPEYGHPHRVHVYTSERWPARDLHPRSHWAREFLCLLFAIKFDLKSYLGTLVDLFQFCIWTMDVGVFFPEWGIAKLIRR